LRGGDAVISVEFKGVTKEYHGRPVLKGVDFAIESGTFSVIFGAPGCGKSVILRLLTGLEKPTSGQVLMRGGDVTSMSPGERNIGYVPQMFALYPHYKVYDNIAYPLRLMGVPEKEVDGAVQQAAERLRITPLLKKNPDQLSGGEKQRVALARGIVKQTDIYVLDDPLTGLDFKLREQLFDDLRQMQVALQATFVYTTSDPLETLMLAEDVVVVDAGQVIEMGPAEAVYAQPQRVRTMELLGFPVANLFPGQLQAREGKVWCTTKLFEFPVQMLPAAPPVVGSQEVSVAVRAQDVRLDPEEANGLLTLKAQVTLKEDLGGEMVVHLSANDTPLVAVVRQDEIYRLTADAVTIGVAPSAVVLYAGDTGQRLGQGAD
jgi:ABC-type sugar transport system ATPase subunit